MTCQLIAVEKLALGAGHPAINMVSRMICVANPLLCEWLATHELKCLCFPKQFAKEDAERKRLNERLQARKKDFRSGDVQQDLSGLIQTRKPFTWEALTYDVTIPGGQKRLLNDIFGYVKPGTLTALMGSSGKHTTRNLLV